MIPGIVAIQLLGIQEDNGGGSDGDLEIIDVMTAGGVMVNTPDTSRQVMTFDGTMMDID